jgi:hypothetical protein
MTIHYGPDYARVPVLVLCDDAEKRPGEEGVYDLHGVRTHVQASSFPYTHPQLFVYLQMAGHEGTASGRLVASNEATDEEIVYQTIGEIRLRGPLTMIHVRLKMLDCEFPSPGVYWFQIFLNEKLVGERRFLVSEASGDVNGQPIA